jgi:uncharacterized integral membrane protein (TIGR00698 family)
MTCCRGDGYLRAVRRIKVGGMSETPGEQGVRNSSAVGAGPVPALAHSHRPSRSPLGTALATALPGLLLAVVIAAAATGVGTLAPIVGGPVSGIVIGVLLALVRKPAARLAPGIGLASKGVLQTAVVILGSQLSLSRIVSVGVGSLPVMLGSLVVCLLAAWVIGRRLGIEGDLRTLIGVGTGICGASAIAAVTPVIGAAGLDVAYAVSTIFVFNVAAVLIFPALGHLLAMSGHAFGLFAGTAVNDTSSVLATASAYGSSAGTYAVVVKLTRTLMIIPICLGLVAVRSRAGGGAASGPGRVRVFRLVPWFLIGFLLMAAANTAGLVPAGAHQGLSELSVFLITVALSAIGLSTDLAGLRRTGPRPLILGACLWAVVATTSLFLQWATNTR